MRAGSLARPDPWHVRALLLLITASAAPAAAQDPAGSVWSCDGRMVSSVVIERQPPAVIGESAPDWARPFLRVALQHRTTQASAVRPFLLLEEGEPCSELLRAESERQLRAQPYLADAVVSVISDGAEGVRVAVSTVDEIPLVIGARARGGRIAGVKYGSVNAMGEGLHATAEWREGFAYRDGVGARFTNYHAFASPARFSLTLERTPTTVLGALALERPLLTSYQRVAWHAGVSDGSGYASFTRRDAPRLALAVDHSRFDAGGIWRLGGETRRVFAGPLVSHDRFTATSQAVVITDSGFVADPDPALIGRYAPLSRTRVAGAVGLRLLSFVTVRGFDALAGAQDLGRGVQLAAIAGRSFASDGDGNVFGLDVYGGAGGTTSFVGARGQWEAERRDRGEWRDAVLSGRLVWYLRRSERRTLVASGDFAGAWASRLPFQLPLGDQAGVRGYADSRIVGARRAVVRAEQRWTVGNFTRFATVGAAGFADVGGVWRGSVPFGESSGLRVGMGVALLAAVPAQSRRTFRVDLALPLLSDPDAKYEVRIGTSAPLRMLGREPRPISSIRSIIPRSAIFGLP